MERHNCFKGFTCCKLYAKDYDTRKGILDIKGFLVPVYYTLKFATNPNPRSSGRDVHPYVIRSSQNSSAIKLKSESYSEAFYPDDPALMDCYIRHGYTPW